MTANFEIYDEQILLNIKQVEENDLNKNEDWDDFEHTDEMENWAKSVENSQNDQPVEIDSKSDNEDQMDQGEDEHQDNQDMLNFIKNQRSESTRIKTNGDVKRFLEFLLTKSEKRKPAEIPPPTLDIYIGHFIMELKRRDNTEYEPSTITGFHR